MGLYIENESNLKAFLAEAQKLCPIRVLDYNHSEKVYDNSIFYQSSVQNLLYNNFLHIVDLIFQYHHYILSPFHYLKT